MNTEILDERQRQALKPAIELIEAGPGAGKTRTVIERMKHSKSKPEKAVALISFTNVAADEAKRRCTREMLAFPHHVGTLDAFLHRYLVTPWFVHLKGKAPTYLMGWDELADNVVHLSKLPGQGFRLSAFKLGADGDVAIPENIRSSDRDYFRSASAAGRSKELEKRGRDIIHRLMRNGVLDSNAARLLALHILEDEDSTVAKRLASRFGEIIIDEFQDCSDIEVRIVRALKARGIHVVAVADPDQAIYEFRDASPESYGNFREEIPIKNIVFLEQNYRSTPAICAFVSAIRSVGTGKIIANNSDDSRKIVVVGGDVNRQRAVFREQLVLHGIAEGESMILAHKRKTAREIAGGHVPDSRMETITSKTFLILRSLMEFSDAMTAKARNEAISRSERTVLSLLSWPVDQKKLPVAEKMEIADINRSDIVIFMRELKQRSLVWQDSDEATDVIRNSVSRHFATKGPTILSVNRSLVKLRSAHWHHWEKWAHTANETGGRAQLPSAHIHSVKGQEFRAVMLGVGRPHGGTGFWELDRDGASDEALRVLYVGASRAEELLVLACKASEVSSVSEFLCETAVPFTVVQ